MAAGPRELRRAALALAAALACAAGFATAPAAGTPQDDRDEILSAFAAELEGGEVSADELADEIAAAVGKRPSDGSPEILAVLRAGRTTGPFAGSFRVAASAGVFSCRARRGFGHERDRASFSLGRGGGSWRGVAGGFGLEHGFGLLGAAPGGWRSLAVGSSLGPGRGGLSGYAGAEDRRALAGAAVGFSGGGWEMGCGAGGPDSRKDDPDRRRTRLLRIGRGGENWAVAFLEASGGTGSGRSLAATLERRDTVCSAEIASWRAAEAASGSDAWAIHLRRRGRWGLCEGMIAGAAQGYAAPLGRLPAPMPASGGDGWALRSRIRLARGAFAGLLLASGTGREPAGDGAEAERRDRIEAAMEARPAADLAISARCRWDTETSTGPDPLAPWDPPQALRRRRENRLVLRGDYSRGADRVRLSLTTVGRSRDEADGGPHRSAAPLERRTVVEIRHDRDLGPEAALRLGTAWAWGDDVDVVTAAAPAPGVVLPRHWGKWSAETSAGFDLVFRGLRLRLAVLRRTAAPGSEYSSRTEIHLDLRPH